MSTQDLVLSSAGGGELSLSRPAETVLKEAEMVAGPWGKKVEGLQLYKKIGDKKHLYIEAWQMVGAMYRVTARVRETRYVEMGEVKGYEAVAEAYHIPTGQVISTAEAMCLNDEDKWGPRAKYEYVNGKREAVGYVATPLQQLRSMAQTRACSKVLSNLFKWVAVMKGYQGTPAEEMTGHEYDQETEAPNIPQPQRKSAAPPKPQQATTDENPFPPPGAPDPQPRNSGGHTISEKQAKRLYAIAMQKGLAAKDLNAFIQSCGFAKLQEIPIDRYDELCSLLETQ